MIYFVCFVVSVLFAYFAKSARNRISFIALSLISILVTSMLAGLRDLSIGIDTYHYYLSDRAWQGALWSSSIWEYLKYYLTVSNERYELLYAFLIGASAQLTGNYNVFLFLVHLIIVGCVYIGAFRMKKHADPEFTLLLFYLLYYNYSLNGMRQYMAMAVIFAAVADIEQRKYLRYCIALLIGTLFHNTALIGILPMFIYMALNPQSRLQNVSFTRRVCVCVIMVIGTFFFVPFTQLLIKAGMISSKYLYYITSDDTSSYLLVRLFLLVEILGMSFLWRSFRRNNENADFYIFCSIAFVLLYLLASMIAYGKRIAAYFSLLNIITLGMMVRSQKLASNRLIVRGAIVSTVLLYWLYVYVYRNASQTMPYVFGI